MRRKLICILASVAMVLGFSVISITPAAASIYATCYGYGGYFADKTTTYTTVGKWTFADGTSNCFGVSPGRAIHVTYPGTPWYEIPGDGRADGIATPASIVNGSGIMIGKQVAVAARPSRIWCQEYYYGQGWTGQWWLCAYYTIAPGDADFDGRSAAIADKLGTSDFELVPAKFEPVDG